MRQLLRRSDLVRAHFPRTERTCQVKRAVASPKTSNDWRTRSNVSYLTLTDFRFSGLWIGTSKSLCFPRLLNRCRSCLFVILGDTFVLRVFSKIVRSRNLVWWDSFFPWCLLVWGFVFSFTENWDSCVFTCLQDPAQFKNKIHFKKKTNSITTGWWDLGTLLVYLQWSQPSSG